MAERPILTIRKPVVVEAAPALPALNANPYALGGGLFGGPRRAGTVGDLSFNLGLLSAALAKMEADHG